MPSHATLSYAAPVRIAVIGLIAIALTACGNSPTRSGTAKSDYEQRMAALLPATQGAILKDRLALEAIRVPERARLRLADIEARLKTTIADLRAITPPAHVAAEHAALIDAYQSLLARFRALGPLARRSTPDKLRIQAGALGSAPAVQEIGNELKAIIAKGYDLGFPKKS